MLGARRAIANRGLVETKVLGMAVMADDGVDAGAVMAAACRLATIGCGNRGWLEAPDRRKVRKHHHRVSQPARRHRNG